MKAARLQAYGDVDQFKVEEVAVPTPGSGEVLIKVEVSAVNHVDLYIRPGYVAQMFPLELPAVLGLDAAGTIDAIGPDVTGFAVGDRVIAHFGINGKGSHAEYAIAPLAGLAKLPANVSFEQGAALPHSGLTGRQAVEALGIQSGDRVLVAGALGAVGRAAVQYLRELGAHPVAGVRAADLDEGTALAGEAIDIAWTPETGRFLYAVATSGATAANTIKNVKDGGRVAIVIPAPEGVNPNVALESIISHDDPATLQKLADAAGRGELVIPVGRTFSLEQLGAAQAALAAGSRGKILLRH